MGWQGVRDREEEMERWDGREGGIERRSGRGGMATLYGGTSWLSFGNLEFQRTVLNDTIESRRFLVPIAIY